VTHVFLDTSGLVAVVNTDDQWHARARSVWQQLLASDSTLLTTSLVLVELGDGLSRVRQRPLAIELHNRLRNSPRIEVVQVTPEMEERGWRLFEERADKEWGVTDCVSFAIMSDGGIRQAFTTDHHFEQAGFERLLS